MTMLIRNSRILTTEGSIFCREVGEGPALVFLHGAWDTSDQWLLVMMALGATHHCLAPDLLGFGSSSHPKMRHSISCQVEMLAECLNKLQIKSMSLIGYSLGGWIATSYALRYPNQVQGLILLAPEGAATVPDDRWRLARLLMANPPWFIAMLRLLYPLAKLWKGQGWMRSCFEQRQLMRQSRTACQLLFQRRAAELRAEQLAEQSQWLKTPILLLHWPSASALERLLIQSYANLLPQAKLQILDVPQSAALFTDQAGVEPVAMTITAFLQEMTDGKRIEAQG